MKQDDLFEDKRCHPQDHNKQQTKKPKIVAQSALSSMASQENSHFYRVIDKPGTLQQMTRLGWKIHDVRLEQEQILLLCFSLFRAEVHLPLSFTILKSKSTYQPLKQLWLEMYIMSINPEDGPSAMETFLQGRIEAHLIPIIKMFITKNLDWSQMISKQFTNQSIMKIFKQTIIKKVHQILEK